jgi:antitoxin component YwqK of YwqJK toxin-antitoxin module
LADENGQKKKEGAWKNHKIDGKWTYWSPDGKESTVLTWKNDKEWYGVWTTWYDNGKKWLEESWKGGKLISKVNYLKNYTIELLKGRGTKMPASDIDAHLKHQNVDEIKELCEEMYHDGKIGRTGNYRYFAMPD